MRIVRVLLGLLLIGVAAAFPYGPLFPWSPWKPGFERLSSARGDIYFDAGRPLPGVYREFDRVVTEAEAFHGFRAPKKITVVVCSNWSQFARLAPYVRGRGAGAITVATGTAIYMTPRLDEGRFDHGEFLRHELSHAVLNQNQSIRAAYASANTWMFEGLAVSFGKQRAYRTRDELVAWAQEHPLDSLLDPDKRDSSFDIRMAYPAWRYFNEYLRATRAESYRGFLTRAMADPSAWRSEFQSAFGVPFPAAVEAYRQDMIGNKLR